VHTTERALKPGPLLPTLIERIPYDVLSRFRMEAGSDGGTDSGGGGDAGKPDPDAKTFTQADLDRHIADRLARDRASKSDYDDLKAAKVELDELKAKGQTEQEKAVTKAAKDAEQAARSDERSKADTRVLRAEVKAAAGAKFASPADALALVDLTGLSVADDGTVDETAIAKRLDDLLAAKPYLAAGSAGGNASTAAGLAGLGQGQRQPAGKVSGKEQGLAMAAKRFGPRDKNT